MFMLVIMLTTVSASSIGTFVINDEMEITNYCRSGVCTFITLESLEFPNGTIIYPNANMTQNGQAYNFSFIPDALGQYTFVSCGDSSVDVCDKDTFFVNFNGEANNIGALIIILIFFMLVFLGYYRINDKINYEKWRDSFVTKYLNRNYIKAAVAFLGYSLISNKFTNYYFIVFAIIMSLNEIVMSYRINFFMQLMNVTMLVYSLGIILVGFLLIGRMQETIYGLLKEIEKKQWGIN